jgi:hypothetical protein
VHFIQLPSGVVINMQQVAYIRGEEAEVYVFFSAAFPNPGETQVMRLRLEKLTATRFCGGFNLTAT